MPTTDFETLLYTTAGPVATITLNRPDRLNTIVPPMPDEIEATVGLAERDPDIKVIVLRGAGRAFCAGYDFGEGFQHWDDYMNTDGQWDPGKDFAPVIPLVALTSRTAIMGAHVNRRRTTICACASVAVIIALNALILFQQLATA